MWLEDQYVPPYVLRAEYLTKDQLKPHKISIIDGKLYQQEQLAQFNDDGDKYLFTVNLDGNLYIIKETETIFHTSLTNGRPVLSAGKIKVENGSIVDVYFESGHYIPSVPIGYQLFSVLKEKSYRFVKTRISFFHDRNKYSAELMPNELSHYDRFYQKLCQTSPMVGELDFMETNGKLGFQSAAHYGSEGHPDGDGITAFTLGREFDKANPKPETKKDY